MPNVVVAQVVKLNTPHTNSQKNKNKKNQLFRPYKLHFQHLA